MVKGSEVGGGGQLEHPRQWLGAQWAGLSPRECRAAQSRQERPEEVQRPSWGAAKGGGHSDHAAMPHEHGAQLLLVRVRVRARVRVRLG